jgi:hypothetical protein
MVLMEFSSGGCMRNVISSILSFERKILFISFLASAITSMNFVFVIVIYYQSFTNVISGDAPAEYRETYEKIFIYGLIGSIAALFTLIINLFELKKKRLGSTVLLANLTCSVIFSFDFIYLCFAHITGNYDTHVFLVAKMLVTPCIVGIIGAVTPVAVAFFRNYKRQTALD